VQSPGRPQKAAAAAQHASRQRDTVKRSRQWTAGRYRGDLGPSTNPAATWSRLGDVLLPAPIRAGPRPGAREQHHQDRVESSAMGLFRGIALLGDGPQAARSAPTTRLAGVLAEASARPRRPTAQRCAASPQVHGVGADGFRKRTPPGETQAHGPTLGFRRYGEGRLTAPLLQADMERIVANLSRLVQLCPRRTPAFAVFCASPFGRNSGPLSYMRTRGLVAGAKVCETSRHKNRGGTRKRSRFPRRTHPPGVSRG